MKNVQDWFRRNLVIVVLAIIMVCFVIYIWNGKKEGKAGNTAGSFHIKLADSQISKKPYSLILYKASWCSHCKEFIEKVWDQMLAHQKSYPSIEFITHDCSVALPNKELYKTPMGVNVKGYPTIILYHRDKQTEIEYNPKREDQIKLEKLIEFLKRHAR